MRGACVLNADIATDLDDVDRFVVERAQTLNWVRLLNLGVLRPGLVRRLAGNGDLLHASLEMLPKVLFDLEPFGILLCRGVAHRMSYPDAVVALREAARLLAPSGHLVVSVPRLDSPLGRGYAHRDRPVGWRFAAAAGESGNVCLYGNGDLSALLVEVGLRVEAVFRAGGEDCAEASRP
ncbi:MAG: class I SAM-dependent methyltransferase [Acidiferrobacterales bacterium]